MCRWILTIVLLLQVLATVPDVLDKDRNYVTKDGERALEIRRDVLFPDRYRVYDEKGLVGTWKKDVLFPDRYRFEEHR